MGSFLAITAPGEFFEIGIDRENEERRQKSRFYNMLAIKGFTNQFFSFFFRKIHFFSFKDLFWAFFIILFPSQAVKYHGFVLKIRFCPLYFTGSRVI
jgi:hypothetical protein